VAFSEGQVEADGFRIRYLEAGVGRPLVYLHGGGGLVLYRSHALLAQRYRVVALEAPGFGRSPANDRTQSIAELANTMAAAARALGIERYTLMGKSFGGKLAAWVAIQHPDALEALVLVGPAAIRPESGSRPAPAATPEARMARLFAHPERQTPLESDPAVVAQQRALTSRLMGSPRDTTLEAGLAALTLPVLVVFGTKDQVVPPAMGRIYRELMPTSHFVLLYDAGHEADADRPEAFADLVTDFLERREGFLVNQESGLYHP
jgi:pimeloyl-ACP methyl ester carboxylesterase